MNADMDIDRTISDGEFRRPALRSRRQLRGDHVTSRAECELPGHHDLRDLIDGPENPAVSNVIVDSNHETLGLVGRVPDNQVLKDRQRRAGGIASRRRQCGCSE